MALRILQSIQFWIASVSQQTRILGSCADLGRDSVSKSVCQSQLCGQNVVKLRSATAQEVGHTDALDVSAAAALCNRAAAAVRSAAASAWLVCEPASETLAALLSFPSAV